MIDATKLKEYELQLEGNARIETALGELDTIVYTSKRHNSDRFTRTWVAPALGYLPVKAQRMRGKKVRSHPADPVRRPVRWVRHFLAKGAGPRGEVRHLSRASREMGSDPSLTKSSGA